MLRNYREHTTISAAGLLFGSDFNNETIGGWTKGSQGARAPEENLAAATFPPP